MNRRLAPLVALAALVSACQGDPRGNPRETPDGDPKADTKASTYKDPMPPNTAPPPGGPAAAQGKAREPANAREVTVSGTTRDEFLPGIKFAVPAEWAKKPASSPMRVAEFTLPGPGGDAELVVFRFAGGGGDAASNINRWRTQFTRADGTPLTEADGKVQAMVRGPLKLTLVDLAGTYVAQVTPGATERYNDANYRMMAVIVEGTGDPYFFKAVGPGATMALWEQSFANFAASFALDSPVGTAPIEAPAPAGSSAPPAAPAK